LIGSPQLALWATDMDARFASYMSWVGHSCGRTPLWKPKGSRRRTV